MRFNPANSFSHGSWSLATVAVLLGESRWSHWQWMKMFGVLPTGSIEQGGHVGCPLLYLPWIPAAPKLTTGGYCAKYGVRVTRKPYASWYPRLPSLIATRITELDDGGSIPKVFCRLADRRPNARLDLMGLAGGRRIKCAAQ